MDTNDVCQQSDPDHLDRLITESQAAKLIGYTARALQNWRLRGGGPRYVKVSACSVRYRRRDLFAWIDERLRSSTSQVDNLALPVQPGPQ